MASETTCRQKVVLTCICPAFFLLLGLGDNFSHSYSPCDEEGIPALGFWTQLNTQHWRDETAHRLLTQIQSRGRRLCARQGHIGVTRGNRVNDQEVWRASFVLSRGCGAHWFLRDWLGGIFYWLARNRSPLHRMRNRHAWCP